MKTGTFFSSFVCFSAIVMLSLTSCSQEPIFFAIEREVALKESSVEGIVNSIVQTGSNVYASNGHLYARNRTIPFWAEIPKPSGAFRINEVATDGTHLYALAANSSWATTGVYRFNEADSSWQALTTPAHVQKISSGNGRIYAFAGSSSGPFAIYITASVAATGFEETPLIENVASFLVSATTAGDYIASRSAIQYFDGTDVTRITGSDTVADGELPGPTSGIIGITETGDGNVYAVTAIGIYRYTAVDGWSVISHNGGTPTSLTHLITSERRLLLVSTTEGYFEVLLAADGTLETTFKPGEHVLSSTAPFSHTQYKNSIGLWNINNILAVADPVEEDYLILASVLNRRYGGLWSYYSPVRQQWSRE